MQLNPKLLRAELFPSGPSRPAQTAPQGLLNISPTDLGTNWFAGGPHAPMGPNNPAHFADIGLGGSQPAISGTNTQTMTPPQMMPFPVAPFPSVAPGMIDFNQQAFNLGSPQAAMRRNINFAQPNMNGMPVNQGGGGNSGDSNARRLFFDPLDIMSNDTERVLFDPLGIFG